MAVSAVRCVRMGAPLEDVAALYGMSVEALEAAMQQAEDSRREIEPADIKPRKLMTVILLREDVPAWQFRQTRKQSG